jgi:hypothetical protein
MQQISDTSDGPDAAIEKLNALSHRWHMLAAEVRAMSSPLRQLN